MIEDRSPPEVGLVRERLARAEARMMVRCLPLFLYFSLILPSRFLITLSLNILDLIAQLESLRSAADHAAGFVNVRGAVPVVCLHDIPNRVRKVALHGVHHGASMALAAAQAHSSHNLRLLPHGFLDMMHPGEHECLVEDFSSTANSVAFNTLADDIVSKVFFGP